MNEYYEIQPRYRVLLKLFLLVIGLGAVLLTRSILSWSQIPNLTLGLMIITLVLGIIKLEYALVWFVFLMPLLASLPLMLEIPNFYLIEVVFLTVILVWLVRLILSKDIKLVKTSLDIPLGIFLLLVVISCGVTLIRINQLFSSFLTGNLGVALQKIFLLDKTTNLPNFYTLRYALTIFEGILVYFFLVNTIRSKGFLRRVMTLMIVSSTMVVGYGVFQYLTRFHLLEYWARQDPNLTRINATFQDPNSLGSYLVLTIFLTGSLFLVERQWKKLFLGCLMVGLGLCLVFSASRTAWASLVLTLVVMIIIPSRKKMGIFLKTEFKRRHGKKIIVVALILLLVFVIALIHVASKAELEVGKRGSYYNVLLSMFKFSNFVDKEIDSKMFHFWRPGWQMVRDHPVFGVGIGSFYWLLWIYLDFPSDKRIYENAHNYFLQIWAELGTAGLVSFLLILVITLRTGVQLLMRVKDRHWRLVTLGLVGGITGFLLTHLTSHAMVLLEMQFIFWSFVAIIFIISNLAKVPLTEKS